MLQATDPVYLSALSPKDSRWDDKRYQADKFKALYQGTEYNCYAIRIAQCTCQLVFAFQVDDAGLCKLKLQAAKFCRVRLCPVCQDRRSMMWRGKTFKMLPKVLEDYPKARFIFLTLTVKNCQLDELRATLSLMHNAWTKLVKRKEFLVVQGWIRAVEVTRAADNLAHPHYHCLLMVRPSYFSGHTYVTQNQWSQAWQSCLEVNYAPIVDVRAVKPSSKGVPEDEQKLAVMAAIVEVIKYTTKPSDIVDREVRAGETVDTGKDWLIELTRQLHHVRAIATGGVLKKYLKSLEHDPEDLIHLDEQGLSESDPESPRLTFDWRERKRRYQMQSD